MNAGTSLSRTVATGSENDVSGLKPGPARPSKTRPAQPNYRPGLGRQIFASRLKIRPGPLLPNPVIDMCTLPAKGDGPP